MGVQGPSGRNDNLRGASCPILRLLHLAGLIGRSRFFDKSHAAMRELWWLMFGILGATLLVSFAKSSFSASKASGSSFTKRRNKSGPYRESNIFSQILPVVALPTMCSPASRLPHTEVRRIIAGNPLAVNPLQPLQPHTETWLTPSTSWQLCPHSKWLYSAPARRWRCFIYVHLCLFSVDKAKNLRIEVFYFQFPFYFKLFHSIVLHRSQSSTE